MKNVSTKHGTIPPMFHDAVIVNDGCYNYNKNRTCSINNDEVIALEIRLNEKLKELRKNKGNTQEELAKYLGISIQSVSKWECGDGFPDITLLPHIAAFYSVTIDELLGVDEEAKNQRIQEIIDEYNAVRSHEPYSDGTLELDYGIDEGIDLIRKAVCEFPDCWFFLQLLASDLWWKSRSSSDEEKRSLLFEAENLCDSIISRCTVDRFRHCANSILCMIYIDSGRRDAALDNAFNSPVAVDSEDWKLSQIYTGEELRLQLRRNIREFMRLLYISVKRMKEEDGDFEFAKEDNVMHVQLAFINDIMKE